MSHIMLPVGIDSFEKLRTNQCYYIDKTGLIEELLRDKFEVNLITRPRRFGKTLAMSMFADFFDIRRDSKALFEGLFISENTELCEKWMNQWPVLYMTLKNVSGLDFESSYGLLKYTIADFCIRNSYLLQSKTVDPNDKAMFVRLAARDVDETEVKSALHTIMRMMHQHFGKQVILLIDEYDVPLAQASENGYYPQMLDVISGLMGMAFKTNESLKFAVVTGCLRIAKESIFTGTNNFVNYSISDERYSSCFGFVQEEVKQLLKDSGFEQCLGETTRWYDGYRFGSAEVYCPWDVLNYVKDLQVSEAAVPGNYWKNTSHNGILRSFIDRTDLAVNDKFEKLLAGGCIQEKLTEDLTYDVLHASEANLWSILYLTGYLTIAAPGEAESFVEPGKVCLKIPNEEIKSIFADTVAVWFTDNVKAGDRNQLFEAFWNGDDVSLSRLITDMLFDTISYYDYKEDYYHAFLAGIFTGAGYAVESNHEYGLGRPDIVIRDRKNRRAILIEVKHSKAEEQLEPDCEAALVQIEAKQYSRRFLKGYQSVICYGVSFFEKECCIRKM